MLGQDQGEDAVVRTHETVASGLEGHGPALGAHAGVHHGHEDGAGRKGAVRGGQREGRRGHVVPGQLVGDVHDGSLRTSGEDGALDRARVVIPVAEIGEQRDDGTAPPGGGTRAGRGTRASGRTRAGGARHGPGL